MEECWPCPVFANYTLAFALQLRETHGKTSVKVAKEIQKPKRFKGSTAVGLRVTFFWDMTVSASPGKRLPTFRRNMMPSYSVIPT
jgi:hypothetical protein